jgi:haloacetate dehalogenase
MFEHFVERELETDRGVIFARVGGTGPPLLLLHGYPQTHLMWHAAAPRLAETFTVVAADLPGYGGSFRPQVAPDHAPHAKRALGSDLVQAMTELGHDRFAVAGHDRGGRVAYRMALDHPDRVERLCVLDVVPTAEQFDRLDADSALEYWPFLLLAQPEPFAERLIAASAENVVRHILSTWAAVPDAIGPERYVRAFTPASIAAWCAEYRAAFHIDRHHDADDRAAGRTIACPVLVHWGVGEDALDGPLAIWQRWAADVRGGPLPGGHFIPEEAGPELTASLRDFLASP